jgi:mRNA degradation ribonuclease J1/J2
MAGKVLLQGNLGQTQTINSGKALAQFLGLEEDLPQVINLANGVRLTLSSKKDCYYYTNSRSCSCRVGLYGKICKHRRNLQEGSSLSPSSSLEVSSLLTSKPLSPNPSVPLRASSSMQEAKASVAQSRAQAQAYQARQRQLRAQVREISSQEIEREPLIQRGGFKPFLEA